MAVGANDRKRADAIACGRASAVSDAGLLREAADGGLGALQCAPAAGMPAIQRRRCGGAGVVEDALSGRLHVLRLVEPHADAVAHLRRAAEKTAAPRRGLCARAGVRPRRSRTVHDGLLVQHHADRRDAWPAPAPGLHDQWHLLRTHSAGCAGIESRRSAPRSVHGRATAPAGLQSAKRAWVTLPVAAGTVLLFESWLRHEVPPNPATSSASASASTTTGFETERPGKMAIAVGAAIDGTARGSSL